MATVSNTASATSTTDTATPTFSAQAIGADGGSDIIYVVAATRSIANATTMACSIDGVSASQIVFRRQDDGGGISSNIAIFALARNSLPDPAQTDVDIVLTHNQIGIRHAVSVYVSPDASVSSFATSNAGAGTTSLNLNTSSGGIVIGGGYNGDSPSFTWTGLTEDVDVDVAGEGSNRFSSASASNVSAETPRTVTITLVTDLAAKVAASFPSAGTVPVDAAQAAFAGQTIDVNEDPILVTAAQAAVAGQDITIFSAIITVDPVEVVAAGQTINLVGSGASLDLSSPLYIALSDDLFITSRLGDFMSPSIHTRRPVPEGAEYPMIVVNPDTSITNEDWLRSRRPVIVRDIIVYGELDSQYRVVEEIAYYLRDKFHRQKSSIEVSGYGVIDIVVVGPFPAPTDDFQHIARGITLTVRLQET